MVDRHAFQEPNGLPPVLPRIPLHRAHITELEKQLVLEALESGSLGGDGPFTKRCLAELASVIPQSHLFLVHSCTAALEMAALLAGIGPGDEVIMPSFTFVSTANAFVLRGARPVFVDIRPDTLNLDENLLVAAITKKTKAIVPVHYGGIGCHMQAINMIARDHQLLVIEDAAQGFDATYQGRALGTWGHLGAFSFHETKNLTSGEGGLLAINDPDFIERAHIIRDKGTNRNKFIEGVVDKYSWVDVGSSYAPSELTAALMLAQIQNRNSIYQKRRAIWNRYQEGFRGLAERGLVVVPSIPSDCTTNYHIYYLVLESYEKRTLVLNALRSAGYGAAFHYIPLHSSSYGAQVGRVSGDLSQTTRIAQGLIRMPLFVDLDLNHVDQMITMVHQVLEPSVRM